MINDGWQLIIENALHLDPALTPCQTQSEDLSHLATKVHRAGRETWRTPKLHKGRGPSNNSLLPPKHHTESLFDCQSQSQFTPALLTGLWCRCFFFFFFFFSVNSEASPQPFAPWTTEKMHSWNSEASPNRSSYSNWWLYKMFVNLSQASYFRGGEGEWKEMFWSQTHAHFEVGAGWCTTPVFFQQADLWVGSTVTVKRRDEWYDLLLLMYSKSVEKRSWSGNHTCIGANCLISPLLQKAQHSHSGWKELWKQGRMTGRTWVHAPTIGEHCP